MAFAQKRSCTHLTLRTYQRDQHSHTPIRGTPAYILTWDIGIYIQVKIKFSVRFDADPRETFTFGEGLCWREAADTLLEIGVTRELSGKGYIWCQGKAIDEIPFEEKTIVASTGAYQICA